MTRDNTWTAGIELDTDVLAATHNGKGTMYVTSGDGKTMRSVDMETGVSAKLSTWANGLDDLAYSKLLLHAGARPGTFCMRLCMGSRQGPLQHGR